MAIKALIDLNLVGDDEYDKTLEASVDSAAISVLIPLKTVRSFSEGGVSYTLDSVEVNKMIIYLTNKQNGGGVDVLAGETSIRDASQLW